MVSKATLFLHVIVIHDSSYIVDGCNFIATVDISLNQLNTTLYFICQSLPDQNSIFTPVRVTGCAVFLKFNPGDADERQKHISNSFWSSILLFSSLRYLVCAVADHGAMATWAEAQQELRKFADKQLSYHRLAIPDPKSNVDNPSWIEVDPLSVKKTGVCSFENIGHANVRYLTKLLDYCRQKMGRQ